MAQPEGILRSELASPQGQRSSGGSGDADLDAAKASLFVGSGGGGGKPAKRQQKADADDDVNRSALFAGSKKPADWCALFHKNRSVRPRHALLSTWIFLTHCWL